LDVLERRMIWALGVVAVALAVLAGAGLISIERAAADGCAASCRSAYNQCRIATKGSSSCEAEFTRCMQSCRRK
jgi:hypothetical protein